MLEVFNDLEALLKGFWLVTIPVTVIFVEQL